MVTLHSRGIAECAKIHCTWSENHLQHVTESGKFDFLTISGGSVKQVPVQSAAIPLFGGRVFIFSSLPLRLEQILRT